MTNQPWALITGASGGIGRQYAITLARDYNYNLFLVSNQEKELADLAREISDTYHVLAESLCLNMAAAEAAEQIYAFAKQHEMVVEVLINNAGMLIFNPFCDTPLPKIETMLMLHMVALTKLAHLFGSDMRARRRGFILNMSSMSAWMAMPGIQTYNATKAFIYNFSKSIWYELKPQNVGITVMAPGAVDTGLFGLAPNLRKLAVALTVSIPPEKLVKRALRKMFRNKKSDTPGVINWLCTPLLKHTPDWMLFLAQKKLAQFMH